MLKRYALALILPLALGIASPAFAAVKASSIIEQAIEGFIRPAYANLSEQASVLRTAMNALCAAPSATNLETARTGFVKTVDAWSSVEIITFGPIREDNRFERMLFWPDRKSIGLKQVQATLSDEDPTASDPSQLAAKSVAMQGFGALEYALYGSGAEALAGKGDPYRCSFGAAVAANIETMAKDVDAAWKKPDGFAALWSEPGSDNPLYRDGSEAVNELMGVFINGLEMMRDVRLRAFLGSDPAKDKPKRALYWRSGNTGMSLAANFEGMDRLFESSRLGDALSPEARWMAESIHIQLVNAAAAAKQVTGSIDKALADPAQREQLEYISLVTSSLSNLFGNRLSAEFGLTAGFSSLDGD